MTWKNGKPKEEPLLKNKKIEDCMLIDKGKTLDCFNLARTSNSFHTKVYGIKVVLQNYEKIMDLVGHHDWYSIPLFQPLAFFNIHGVCVRDGTSYKNTEEAEFILDDTRFESCGGKFFRKRRKIQIEVDPFTEPVFTDNHFGFRRTASKMRLRFRKRA